LRQARGLYALKRVSNFLRQSRTTPPVLPSNTSLTPPARPMGGVKIGLGVIGTTEKRSLASETAPQPGYFFLRRLYFLRGFAADLSTRKSSRLAPALIAAVSQRG
jgi:hypothetical protein